MKIEHNMARLWIELDYKLSKTETIADLVIRGRSCMNRMKLNYCNNIFIHKPDNQGSQNNILVRPD
jgi:hypothetical protein